MKSRLARAFAVVWSSLIGSAAIAQTQPAVEYYYAAWDHYFVTAFPDEIAVLDGGAFGGVWKRTGETFSVWSDASSGALPACRFFSTAFAPRSSHFYTPYAAECASLKTGSTWQYESIAYYLQLPQPDGTCATGTVALYRLYNDGQGAAPNHRYTTSRATFDRMQTLGWTFEGDGRTGVFACVPPTAATGVEGLWRATASSGRTILAAFLDDGTYYVAYSSVGGGLVDGSLFGTATAANGAIVSTRGRNVALRINTMAGGSNSVTGLYVPKTSLNLTIGSGATAETAAATYDPAYDTQASAALVAGTYKGWSGHSLDAFPSTTTIDATGKLTVNGGCNHRGRIVPRGTTGIFDLTLMNGCALPGAPPQTGIVIFDAVRNSIAAISPLNDDDIVFVVGDRQ